MNEIRELNVADDIYIGTADYDIENLFGKLKTKLDRTDNYVYREFIYLNYAYSKRVNINYNIYNFYIGFEHRCSEEVLEDVIQYFKEIIFDNIF